MTTSTSRRTPGRTAGRGATAPGALPEFTGFSDAAIAFYEGLEADNSKAYWTDHREVYENQVKAPLLALAASCEDEFGEAKLFRPYRDVRFSKDKSLYKTEQGMTLTREPGHPSFYVHLSPEGLMVGGGYYEFTSDQLSRFRDSVRDERVLNGLVEAVDTLTGAGMRLGGKESLKRVPPGFDPGHPNADLFRLKGLVGLRTFGEPAWMSTKRCRTEVVKHWRALEPLFAWLVEHVGLQEHVDGDPRRQRTGRATRRPEAD